MQFFFLFCLYILLYRLFRSGKNIGDEGAIAVARTLGTNTSLQRLVLDVNNIGNRGANAIAEALVTNISLRELNLVYVYYFMFLKSI